MKKKVVVGMSGGVDSSVAAYLLKEQGYDVIGVTMQIWQDKIQTPGGDYELANCSGEKAVEDAAAVCRALEIPFHVLNFKETFQEKVIQYFVEEYLHGRTPNPCNVCNRYVKWEALLNRSKEFGADYIATGHYARICQLPNGRYTIRNSVTAHKDQTYALYNLTQEQLRSTLMPVGEYEKDKIRQIAIEQGIPVANKPDSQEICFVPEDDYAAYIDLVAGDRVPGPGNFVDTQGNVLGTHRGITHYTIGQRRGLELPMGKRVFVTKIKPETNEVVIGSNEDTESLVVICNQVNFMAIEELEAPRHVMAKIRYNHGGSPCTISKGENQTLVCRFDTPVRAATPGQAIVFYEQEYVLGGGTIIDAYREA